jgi:NADPH-dependent curcumin reductase CurA
VSFERTQERSSRVSANLRPGRREFPRGEPADASVAEVVESRHPEYRPGDLVQARIGWRTHAAISITGVRRVDPGR